MIYSLAIALFVLYVGMALWTTTAVINNYVDSKTNVSLIASLLTMELLAESDMGLGLRERAADKKFAGPILKMVMTAQVIVAFSLWRAAFFWGEYSLGIINSESAISAGNLAATLFIALWLTFMTGGLWFGYWMKQGLVQQVHMALLNFGILTLILNNSGR